MSHYTAGRSLSLILLLAICLSGCIFEPNETYFKEVAPPDTKAAFVHLDNYDQSDTIFIFGTTKFTYDIPDNAFAFTATLGNLELLGYTEDPTSFSIPNFRLKTGTFFLTLTYKLNSGTGSLADNLRSEIITKIRTWTVIVDVRPPSTPIVTMSTDNGLLKLSWPKHPRPDFLSYVVVKHEMERVSNFSIKDADASFWVDSSFVGGYQRPIEYEVYTYSENGSATSSSSFNTSLGVKFDFNPADSSATITWRKTPYYAAFKNYNLTLPNNLKIIIADVSDITRTIHLDGIIFSEAYPVNFEVDSKKDDYDYSSYGIQHSFVLGEPLGPGVYDPSGGAITYNEYLKAYTMVRSNKLLVFDDNFNITKTITTTSPIKSIPYPGRYVYSLFEGTPLKILMLDLADNSVSEKRFFFTSSLSFGDRGYYAETDAVWSSFYSKYTYGAVVLNMFNDKNYFYTSSSSSLKTTMSSDGNYFVVNDTAVYKCDADTSAYLGQVPAAGSFRNDSPGMDGLIFDAGGNLSIYDPQSLSLVRTIASPDPKSVLMYYERSANKFVYAGDKMLYIVDGVTGEVLRLHTGGYFVNKFIFSGDRYLKIL